MAGADQCAPATGADPERGPMRYEKAETVLGVALDMQASVLGLSLEEIRRNYPDKPLRRRTAERLRHAVERLFPQLEQKCRSDCGCPVALSMASELVLANHGRSLGWGHARCCSGICLRRAAVLK